MAGHSCTGTPMGALSPRARTSVTGFVSFARLGGGDFAKTGLIDGIGNGPGSSEEDEDEGEPSSGILTVSAR